MSGADTTSGVSPYRTYTVLEPTQAFLPTITISVLCLSLVSIFTFSEATLLSLAESFPSHFIPRGTSTPVGPAPSGKSAFQAVLVT